MKRINSLSDLLMEELADLLNAEIQLAQALPKMTDASQSAALKTALQECLKITKAHINRLQDIFSNIGQSPQKMTCEAMNGFITAGENIVNKNEKDHASDAAIINVAQQVQQYEIARYKTVREHAADLGHTKIVEVLTKTLNEQRAMNFHFNELSQGMINVQAIDPQRGFYMTKERLGRGGVKKKAKNKDISRFISEGNPNSQES